MTTKPALILQLEQDDVNKPRPFPYIIDRETGDVADQDFWKGDPVGLMGFQENANIQRVNLLFEDWAAGDIQKAVGMYPVFVTKEGRLYAMTLPVGEVGTVGETPQEGPELAKGDQVRIGKGYQLWTVEVYGNNWFLASDPSQGILAGTPQIKKPLTPQLRKRLTKVTPEIQAEMNNVLDRKNGWI